eukprot:6168898-Amphidinium_carterae.1
MGLADPPTVRGHQGTSRLLTTVVVVCWCASCQPTRLQGEWSLDVFDEVGSEAFSPSGSAQAHTIKSYAKQR